MGGLIAQQGFVEHCQKEGAGGQRSVTQRRQRLDQRIQGHTRRTRVKAVPEWVTSRAPPAPDRTPLQQTVTWPGPPTDPPAEMEEMEVEDTNPPRNARERTLIVKWRVTCQKVKNSRWDSANWDISCSVLDEDHSATSLAENARDEGGYSRFVLLDTRRGKEVADAACFCEEPRKTNSERTWKKR